MASKTYVVHLTKAAGQHAVPPSLVDPEDDHAFTVEEGKMDPFGFRFPLPYTSAKHGSRRGELVIPWSAISSVEVWQASSTAAFTTV